MKKILPYTGAAVALALLYVVWVLAIRRQAPAPTPPTGLPKEIEEMTAKGLKILHFYGHTPNVEKGEHLIICYGVRDARAVRLEPPLEALSPSLNRCIAVQVEALTTFRLVAEGNDGAEASASFSVNVVPAAPRIIFVGISQKEIRRGTPLAICYGVKHAVKVQLNPGGVSLPPSEKQCLQFYPVRTTHYTFLATGEDGRTDQEKFTITVK
jgi:hypothetical protein